MARFRRASPASRLGCGRGAALRVCTPAARRSGCPCAQGPRYLRARWHRARTDDRWTSDA
eukprot:1391686-Prymnesium_polylepis.2